MKADSFERWPNSLDGALIHQLKLLLEKTALKAFPMLIVETMNEPRLLCVIDSSQELRCLEFHHKFQGDESIEELGLELQVLHFHLFMGRSFDRLH